MDWFKNYNIIGNLLIAKPFLIFQASLPKEDFDLFRVFDEDIENADEDDDDSSEGDEVYALTSSILLTKLNVCCC